LILFLTLLIITPALSQADTDIKINVCDPTSTGEVKYEGTTVNTVLDTPTVSFGENRKLGTLRITGKQGVDVPLRPGNRVMVTLPEGLCYMQVPNAANYRNYVEWPPSLDGVKNQICDTNGKSGIKFISGTPCSVTVEVNNVEGSGKTVLDFVFNKEGFSAVRVSRLIEAIQEYKNSNEKVTRMEFIKMLADVTVPFPSALKLIENDQPLEERFHDLPDLTSKEKSKIKKLVDSGVVVGYPGGELKPGEFITRAQAVSLVGKILPPANKQTCFKDPLPDWAAENICAAEAGGVVVGYPDGTFRPEQVLTRSEAFSILQKTLEFYSLK